MNHRKYERQQLVAYCSCAVNNGVLFYCNLVSLFNVLFNNSLLCFLIGGPTHTVGAKYVQSNVCGRNLEVNLGTPYKASYFPKETQGAKYHSFIFNLHLKEELDLCVCYLRTVLLLLVIPWSLKKIHFSVVVPNIIFLMAHYCNKFLMHLICSVAYYMLNTTGLKCNVLRDGCYEPVKSHDPKGFGW